VEIFGATKLEAFWKIHPEAKPSLARWRQIATQARWASIVDVQRVYPSVDFTKGTRRYC
jgi:mRNA-degrading endonuclease HigB of HigAB toxin-antitoxin module